MSSAAAPMIGVASRNAKRAASSLSRPGEQPGAHRRARARHPGNQPRSPGRCRPPLAWRQLERGRGARRDRGTPASAFAGARRRSRSAPSSMRPLRTQEPRGARLGDANSCAQRLLGQQAETSDGDRARDQAASPAARRCRRRGSRVRAASAARRGRCASSPTRRTRAARARLRRGRDEEREEVAVVLMDVPTQDARQDHAVAERGDGERLGDTLQQSEDRAPAGSLIIPARGRSGDAAPAFGPLCKPGVGRTRRKGDRDRRDPVLDVMVAVLGVARADVAGEERGSGAPARGSTRRRRPAARSRPARPGGRGVWRRSCVRGCQPPPAAT